MKLCSFMISIFLIVHSQYVQSESALGSKRLKEAQRLADLMQVEKIVGGKMIGIEDRPWQVAILASNKPDYFYAQFCGGVAIDSTWILTAAHCVDNGTLPDQIRILSKTAQLDGSGTLSLVEAISIHPAWSEATKQHDLAFIKLKQAIPGIPSIDISTSEDLDNSSELTLSGWGRIGEFKSKSDVLLQVSVPIQNQRTRCNAKESYDGRVLDTMFCAGKQEGGKDTCQGDSGGPATIEVDGTVLLAGVASWGDGCGEAKKYGVYTRLPSYASCIRDRSFETCLQSSS